MFHFICLGKGGFFWNYNKKPFIYGSCFFFECPLHFVQDEGMFLQWQVHFHLFFLHFCFCSETFFFCFFPSRTISISRKKIIPFFNFIHFSFFLEQSQNNIYFISFLRIQEQCFFEPQLEFLLVYLFIYFQKNIHLLLKHRKKKISRKQLNRALILIMKNKAFGFPFEMPKNPN